MTVGRQKSLHKLIVLFHHFINVYTFVDTLALAAFLMCTQRTKIE